jgi:hypothetical protein
MNEDNSDSVELIESTADYEAVQYPRYPKCHEYHYQSGQVNCSHIALKNIPDDGIKYHSVVDELEPTEILWHGVGTICGRLHWLYTVVKVSQGGKWYTVLLTDSCIDRLLGYNAAEFQNATGDAWRTMKQTKMRRFTRLMEKRLKLLVHWDSLKDILFVSAITFLKD